MLRSWAFRDDQAEKRESGSDCPALGLTREIFCWLAARLGINFRGGAQSGWDYTVIPIRSIEDPKPRPRSWSGATASSPQTAFSRQSHLPASTHSITMHSQKALHSWILPQAFYSSHLYDHRRRWISWRHLMCFFPAGPDETFRYLFHPNSLYPFLCNVTHMFAYWEHSNRVISISSWLNPHG